MAKKKEPDQNEMLILRTTKLRGKTVKPGAVVIASDHDAKLLIMGHKAVPKEEYKGEAPVAPLVKPSPGYRRDRNGKLEKIPAKES